MYLKNLNYLSMRNLLLKTGAFAILLSSSCLYEGASSPTRNSRDNNSSSKAELKVSNCLESFNYDYVRMLTIDDIVKNHDVGDLLKVEIKDGEVKGEYGSVTYIWPSGRPDIQTKINTIVMGVPDPNSVILKKLAFYDNSSEETVEHFSRSYEYLSTKELKEVNVNLEKNFGDDPERLAQAKSLMKSRESMNFELIEGIGTRAYWRWGDKFGGELVSLIGRSKFTVITKVSIDSSENLELAKRLALEVINKCN
jgi:hypothetical protein